jgi:uncharacterized membrane protein HdeD (DUF308 family)
MVITVLARNWWTLALRGVCAILFGVMAIAWPAITLTVMVLFYGAYALADGTFAIAAAVTGRTHGLPWWSFLAQGVAGITIGVITFFWPGITALALLCLIAAWAVITGVFEIIAAVRLRKEIRGEWIMGLSGVLSLVLGVLLVARPTIGLVWIAWMTGFYAILFGSLLLVLGFRLRRLSRELIAAISPSPADGRTASAAMRPTPNTAR